MNVKKLNHAVESLRHSLKENDADPRTFQAADKVWDAIDVLDKKVSVLKRVAKSKWDKTEVDQMENLLDKFRDAVENVLMANDPDMQEGEKIQEDLSPNDVKILQALDKLHNTVGKFMTGAPKLIKKISNSDLQEDLLSAYDQLEEVDGIFFETVESALEGEYNE